MTKQKLLYDRNGNSAHYDEKLKPAGISRRDFIKSSTIITAGMALPFQAAATSGATVSDAPKSIKIERPFHGAILNRRHGREVDGGLRIPVSGIAPADAVVSVNGTKASRAGTVFSTEIVLRDKETDIIAVARGQSGKRESRVRVVWDRHSLPRYHFSLDDNSFFLRDIAQKKYASLFDCFYLKMLRRFHMKYKTKFVLNCYYATEDGFTLREFPDRYKAELRDNADWLQLAFHAHADAPSRPYQDTPPEKLIADLKQVNEQIVRFAGEEVCSLPTNLHWAMCRQSAFKPLYEQGVRVLSGYFHQRDGKWDINYRFDGTRSEYISQHDMLKDFDSGIIFTNDDIVCNSVPVDQIKETLVPQFENPNRAEIMLLLSHEQYFWPFYKNFIPDHEQRLDVALRLVTERGYKPVFFHEGLLGGPG